MSDSQSSNLKLENLTIRGVTLDALAVTELHIFESITQPGITGTIEFKDWQGLMELGHVVPGDDVVIAWSSENKSIISRTFVLTAQEAVQELDTATYNVYKLHFCSKWSFSAFATKYTEVYRDKYIHEIVRDILEVGCGATVKFIEPTKQKLENYCLPMWTPARSLKRLLSFAQNQSGVGGYVVWTDLDTDQVMCTTVDYMLKKSIGYWETFYMRSTNTRYEGSVKSITGEQHFDLVRYLNMGMFHTNLVTMDYDRDDLFTTDEDIKKYSHKHVAKKYPMPTKYASEDYAIARFSSIYPSTDSISKELGVKELAEGELRTDYTMFFTDAFKVNVLSVGESSRRCGMMAKLDYPSVDENKQKFNKKYQGDYLIRSIRHVFGSGDYFQAITLASDGYFDHPGDLVEW